MSNLAIARRLLHAEYCRIWQEWYSDSNCVPADIVVEDREGASGYSPEENRLFLLLPEANLAEAVDDLTGETRLQFKGLDWNVWRRELVHEMLHEYQHKTLGFRATPGGRELSDKSVRKFSGSGHGADFYSAIADRALYFGLTPEELVTML